MKFILLLFLLSYNFYNGQVKRFIYDCAFVSDSTKPNEITKEVMFLDVVKGKSQFYSAEQYKVDFALAADGKKGIFSMPPNKNLIRYKVQKTESTATIESEMDGQKYFIKDERILNWKILKDTDTLSGFPVQKAELNFADRNWIAWFTSEIPLQEGPYKFRGLPGLILKIQDKKGNHLFLI